MTQTVFFGGKEDIMIQSKADILVEIDKTVDQLLENETMLKKIQDNVDYIEETSALRHTQESLLAHLIHMDELYKEAQNLDTPVQPLQNKQIHAKLGKSGYLNSVSKHCQKNPKTSASKGTQAKDSQEKGLCCC